MVSTSYRKAMNKDATMRDVCFDSARGMNARKPRPVRASKADKERGKQLESGRQNEWLSGMVITWTSRLSPTDTAIAHTN